MNVHKWNPILKSFYSSFWLKNNFFIALDCETWYRVGRIRNISKYFTSEPYKTSIKGFWMFIQNHCFISEVHIGNLLLAPCTGKQCTSPGDTVHLPRVRPAFPSPCHPLQLPGDHFSTRVFCAAARGSVRGTAARVLPPCWVRTVLIHAEHLTLKN